MLSPATTIRPARSARRWYAASTSPVQSAQPVVSISSTVVPWPGRQRQLDVEAAAGHRLGEPAHRRRVAGEAVEGQHTGRAVIRGVVRPRLGACDDVHPDVSTARIVAPYRRYVRRRSRQIEASAVAALGPVLVIAPFCLLALFVIWLAVRLVWDVSFWWFAARLRGRRRAAVRAPDPGVRADPAVRRPPPDRGRARPHVPALAGHRPRQRPAAGPLHPPRAAERRAQRLRLRRPPRRRHDVRPRRAAPRASWPACSPTSSATTSACTPSA